MAEHIEVPESWSHERAVIHLLKEIMHDQKQTLQNQRTIMAAIDTLNTNIAKLKADTEAFIAASQAGSETAIQAAADAVAAIDAEVVAATPTAPAPASGQ